MQEQIAKVAAVEGAQARLVDGVNFGGDFGQRVGAGALVDFIGREGAVFPTLNDVLNGTGGEACVVDVIVEQHAFDQTLLVVVIENGELRGEADDFRMAAQELGADGVEGAHPERSGFFGISFRTVEVLGDALAHLGSGPIGEGNRKDLPREGPLGVNEVGNTRGEHARFTGACARKHEDRAFGGNDGEFLFGVEAVQIGGGGGWHEVGGVLHWFHNSVPEIILLNISPQSARCILATGVGLIGDSVANCKRHERKGIAMHTTYQIRPATQEDAIAIAALMSELYLEEGSGVIAQGAKIAAALGDVDTPVALSALVASVGERVVAALLYYPGYDTLSASYGYHLADIVVTKPHRRSGVGRALMKELAAITLKEKKEWVSLTVLKANDAARAFYASLGMSQVDVDFFAMGPKTLAKL